MIKQNCCFVCKIVSALVILGAVNWGLIGAFQIDIFARLFGSMPSVARVVYILVGLAGLMKLVSCFKVCPCCKSSCDTKS